MHEKLLDQLKQITSEECEILKGQSGVDRSLYTSGKNFVVDKDKMLARGRLIDIRPHTRFVHFPEHTHIQYAIFNTIYQLMAVKKEHPEQMEQAKAMLTTPDYFQFLLTGVKMQEYTMATTGQLIDPKTFDWDYELIDMLGYNREIFREVHMPGTSVGHFREEIQKEVGFDCEVVLCGSHDTASAVLAVPANDDDFLYISSGTWSLMGIEKKEADCSAASQKANLTNEGGYDKRYRYLSQIRLPLLQVVSKTNSSQ